MKSKYLFCYIALSFFTALASSGFCQGTAFNYQGRLNDHGAPASGSYDLQFTVYDVGTNGNVVGGPVTNAATIISNGLFNVLLDCGDGVFNGSARWIQIGVRTNGDSGAFMLLTPRQPVSSTPYAMQSIHAATATSATNAITAATAAAANSVAGTNITGTINIAQLPPSVVLNNGSAVTLTGALTLPLNGLTVGSANNQVITLYNRVGIAKAPVDDPSNPILSDFGVALGTPKLEVGGSVAIPGNENYTFRTGKTHYYNIPAAELVSANPTTYQGRIDDGFSSSNVNGLNSLWATGGTPGTVAYFVAPVHLPDFATITGLQGHLVKNGGSLQSVIELYRSDASGYLGNTASLIASAATTGSGGVVWTVAASSINSSFSTVDNANYVYFLRYSGEQNTQNVRFVSARIMYTVHNVE
ncbi:hypothetical protein [Pedosphaera parvula]|uniref:Uncharacterized protein n=1 Tax=Pedosphaera parvula (strain Ellin514) TaxID=320771 RepID=B9XJV6_PEDPL|nr:hypothetical protein [Pedosphaera parvula]EEF59779.1 hypothetical protein Cflav_PD2786 [Pedosphaera parvula Ellin514]